MRKSANNRLIMRKKPAAFVRLKQHGLEQSACRVINVLVPRICGGRIVLHIARITVTMQLCSAKLFANRNAFAIPTMP